MLHQAQPKESRRDLSDSAMESLRGFLLTLWQSSMYLRLTLTQEKRSLVATTVIMESTLFSELTKELSILPVSRPLVNPELRSHIAESIISTSQTR